MRGEFPSRSRKATKTAAAWPTCRCLRRSTNHSNLPRREVPGDRDWLSWTSAPGRGRPPRGGHGSRPHAAAARPAPLVRMRGVPTGKSLRTPPAGLRLAPRLRPLSSEACRLGETARAAAGRGLCGPKAAAVAPACGKCQQAALRFVAPRPPHPGTPCDRRGTARPRREYRSETLRRERGRRPAVPVAPLRYSQRDVFILCMWKVT
ncbi:uncharacterized protein [Vicugna pacos]|uniref:Uncharacterized protein n=1 Tax=Vicugna pacos TaxID=30538 RepID=A0ABM5DKH4_VICPA